MGLESPGVESLPGKGWGTCLMYSSSREEQLETLTSMYSACMEHLKKERTGS